MNVFFLCPKYHFISDCRDATLKISYFSSVHIRDHRKGTKPARGRQYKGFVFSSLPSLPFCIEEKQTRFVESGVGDIKILHERKDKSTIRLN